MKKCRDFVLFCLSLIFTMTVELYANSSLGQMSYQAVIRNAENELVKNSTVGVRFAILRGASALEPVYVETHRALSNENGLISLTIGAGERMVGPDLTGIDWENGEYFLQVEIDPEGGTNYVINATTPFMSVPYAMYAQKAQQLTGDISYENLTDKPALFSGRYEDLSNLPEYNFNDSVAKYGFSGDYNDLRNAPSMSVKDSVVKYGFSGRYEDLANLPEYNFSDSIVKYGFSGDYNELRNVPSVSMKDSVAKYGFSGNYEDLNNKPSGESDGDILYWNGQNGDWEILPIGLEGQFLGVVDGKLMWCDPLFANTSAETYKEGDIYMNNGVPEGIVFEVSTLGRYAKIVSLTEIDGIAWDPKGTEDNLLSGDPAKSPALVGASSATDGKTNTDVVRRISGWMTAYPAFAECANMGDWYLPSLNEMKSIYEQKDEINRQLTEASGTKIEKNTYWTSTETDAFYAKVVAFNSYSITVGEESISILPGEDYETMKGDTYTVRPVRRLSWTEATSKPVEGKVYSLGEIVYEDLQPVGIVYEITDGGLHGKMLSIQETSLVWGDTISVGTSDIDNGLNNQNVVSGLEISDYPSFEWVRNLGADWYLPSINELITLKNKMAGINNLLPDAYQLSDAEYWSSTEVDATKAQSVDFSTGDIKSDKRKDTILKVRAVKIF